MTDETILDEILEREGGYSNHPADRGGPTKYGITLPTLAVWRGHSVSPEDVRALTAEEAKAIYRERYLQPFLHVEPIELRAQVVDIAVHSGVDTARMLYRRARDQGGNPQAALVRVRLKYLARVVAHRPSNAIFLSGWIDRALSFLPEMA